MKEIYQTELSHNLQVHSIMEVGNKTVETPYSDIPLLSDNEW